MKQILKQTKDEKKEDVKSLSINSYPVSKLPQDIIEKLKEFVNLEELSIASCGLRSMENFERMEKIKKLELIDNFVTTNTLKQIVQRFPNVEVLILSGNYIFNLKEMEPLNQLKKLRFLDVTTNQIREQNLEEQLFQMFENLEVCNNRNRKGESVQKKEMNNFKLNMEEDEIDEEEDEDDEEYLEEEEIEEIEEEEDEQSKVDDKIDQEKSVGEEYLVEKKVKK